MPNLGTPTRRTVCRSVLALVGGLSTVRSVRGDTTDEHSHGRHRRSSASSPRDPAADRFDVYPGAVDRIVDDTFVVILLESNGRVVDEIVERRAALPPLSEGDRVIAVLEGETVRCVVPVSGETRP